MPRRPELDEPYLARLEDIQVDPIFIMGLNRSGTTLLYHLLNATGLFNAVTVFHIVNRDRLIHLHLHPDEKAACHARMARWFEQRQLRDRRYDRIPVGPHLPEEYGYALRYRAVKPRLTRRNIPPFLDFARKIQLTEDPGRPLLLKNPWDTNNFMAVRRALPRARFVFIHRHPLLVISSQVKMFGDLIRRPSEYDMLIEENYRRLCESRVLRTFARAAASDRLPLLRWRIYRHVVASCDYMLANVELLEEGAVSVTYPALCNDTNQVIRQILEFLRLDPPPDMNYSAMVQPRQPALHAGVERMKHRIERRTAAYRQRFSV